MSSFRPLGSQCLLRPLDPQKCESQSRDPCGRRGSYGRDCNQLPGLAFNPSRHSLTQQPNSYTYIKTTNEQAHSLRPCSHKTLKEGKKKLRGCSFVVDAFSQKLSPWYTPCYMKHRWAATPEAPGSPSTPTGAPRFARWGAPRRPPPEGPAGGVPPGAVRPGGATAGEGGGGGATAAVRSVGWGAIRSLRCVYRRWRGGGGGVLVLLVAGCCCRGRLSLLLWLLVLNGDGYFAAVCRCCCGIKSCRCVSQATTSRADVQTYTPLFMYVLWCEQ